MERPEDKLVEPLYAGLDAGRPAARSMPLALRVSLTVVFLGLLAWLVWAQAH